MSLNPQAPRKGEGLAVTLLSLPFIALDAAGSRIAAAITKKSPQAPKAEPVAPASKRMPDITANLHYAVADRVCSAQVRGRQVSFFHYFSAQVIRISCRELRHLKPIEFTRSVADAEALVFDIDGAIEWVRKHGLESPAVKRTPAKPAQQEKSRVEPSAQASAESSQAKEGASARAPVSQLNIVPETGSKGVPFTGRIVSFGITKRSGGQGKQPYMTYAIKLQSESGAYEKEFIGEHLSELVTELSLKPQQLVRIQLLGKHHFEVEVEGKMQARSRNHFSITVL